MYQNVNQELYVQACKNQMEIAKKQELERISIYSEEQKAMLRADVASRRELQRTDILIKKGQKIRISKEMFGGKCYDETEFSISQYFMLVCIGNEEDRILAITFQTSDNQLRNVYIGLEDLEDRIINKKLNSVGINFGFAYAKETAMRKLLIAKLIETAPTCCIPPNHGWYKSGEEIKFSFPEECVWEEVLHNV